MQLKNPFYMHSLPTLHPPPPNDFLGYFGFGPQVEKSFESLSFLSVTGLALFWAFVTDDTFCIR